MTIMVAFAHVAKLPALAAIIEVERLVVHALCLMPAALLALWVAAAWLFLPDQPRHGYR